MQEYSDAIAALDILPDSPPLPSLCQTRLTTSSHGPTRTLVKVSSSIPGASPCSQTSVGANGQSVTTLYRAIRPNKEDRVAKFEWAANGALGRVIIGKTQLSMADLVRPDRNVYGARVFNGPDGLQYRWRPSSNGNDVVLQDQNNNVIAFFRPIRQTRYQIGDVYGELHFVRTAGAGTVMHPPIMDTVTVTAMLYRFCAAWNL